MTGTIRLLLGFLLMLATFWMMQSPAFAIEKPKDARIDYFTVAPKVSYLWFMAHDDTELHIPVRNGAQFSCSFDIGDIGYSFEIAPLIAIEDHGNGMPFFALGANLGLAYRFYFHHIVPSFGVGIRGTYLLSEAMDKGTEIYGRFPFAVSFYATPNWAIVLEIGLMYGVTGMSGSPYNYQNLPKPNPDPKKPAGIEQKPNSKFLFADGFGLDATIGFRFP